MHKSDQICFRHHSGHLKKPLRRKEIMLPYILRTPFCVTSCDINAQSQVRVDILDSNTTFLPSTFPLSSLFSHFLKHICLCFMFGNT